jgi:hypothetical protein
MSVTLHGWIEVEKWSGAWVGIIKIGWELFPSLSLRGFQESLYQLDIKAGFPDDISDEAKSDFDPTSSLRLYHILWGEAWQIDTESVYFDWWMLHRMIEAIELPNTGEKAAPTHVRLVFWTV